MAKCYACLEEVHQFASVCPHCRSALSSGGNHPDAPNSAFGQFCDFIFWGGLTWWLVWKFIWVPLFG